METLSAINGVIIADDDPMIRRVLQAKLEAIGVNVSVTANGVEAVELASRIKAALIFLDLNMPRLNGLLACQRIRKLPGNAQTPIVILTSTLGKDPEAACARVGATAYFTKPFVPALLLQAVSRFLPIDDTVRDSIRRNADHMNGILRGSSTPASTASAKKAKAAG